MRTTSRVIITAILAVLLAFAGSVTAQAYEPVDNPASKAVQHVNAHRGRTGLQPLTWNDELAQAAQAQLNVIMAEQRLSHSDLNQYADRWCCLGEIVGRGPHTYVIHKAYLASPSHRAQIETPTYTQAGAAAERVNGVVWNVVLMGERR